MQAIDDYIPDPTRALDRPFSLPVEDVFSIQGRGTVVTGRIEQGVVKVGEEIEIIGIQPATKTTVTGMHIFRSTCITRLQASVNYIDDQRQDFVTSSKSVQDFGSQICKVALL